MSAARERAYKRLGLFVQDMPKESFDVFEERTRGMLDMRWPGDWSRLHEAVKLYGFDCYMAGLLDGEQVGGGEISASSLPAIETKP